MEACSSSKGLADYFVLVTEILLLIYFHWLQQQCWLVEQRKIKVGTEQQLSF